MYNWWVLGSGPWRGTEDHAVRQAECRYLESGAGWQLCRPLVFDDGHDTGLFSWDILHDYGMRQDSLMAEYLDCLAAAGQPRG